MDQYQEKDYTVSSWKEFEKVYNDVKAVQTELLKNLLNVVI